MKYNNSDLLNVWLRLLISTTSAYLLMLVCLLPPLLKTQVSVVCPLHSVSLLLLSSSRCLALSQQQRSQIPTPAHEQQHITMKIFHKGNQVRAHTWSCTCVKGIIFTRFTSLPLYVPSHKVNNKQVLTNPDTSYEVLNYPVILVQCLFLY